MLPSFVIFYLLIISLLTDQIARYIYIVFPFCILFITIESYKIICQVKARYITITRSYETLIFIILFIFILSTTPRPFTQLSLTAKFMNSADKDSNEFKSVINGEPVFCLYPFEAFKVGGLYRIFPNDSLEKVVTYAKKTNIRWILISRTQSSIDELQLYNNAKWYFADSLDKAYPEFVKFRLGSKDGVLALYEIL